MKASADKCRVYGKTAEQMRAEANLVMALAGLGRSEPQECSKHLVIGKHYVICFATEETRTHFLWLIQKWYPTVKVKQYIWSFCVVEGEDHNDLEFYI